MEDSTKHDVRAILELRNSCNQSKQNWTYYTRQDERKMESEVMRKHLVNAALKEKWLIRKHFFNVESKFQLPLYIRNMEHMNRTVTLDFVFTVMLRRKTDFKLIWQKIWGKDL